MKVITAIGLLSALPFLTVFTLLYFGTHRLKLLLNPVQSFNANGTRRATASACMP